MTTQSIVCGACSASVPYGRLSCPSCGELLASVTGARRGGAASIKSANAGSTANAASAAVSLPDVLYDLDSAPTAQVVDGQLALDNAPRDRDGELPWAGAGNGTDAQSGDHASAADQDGWDDEVDGGDLEGLLADDEPVTTEIAAASTTAGHAWAVKGASMTGPSTPAYMPRPNRAQAAAAAASAAATAAAQASVLAGSDMQGALVGTDLPGAYVPPLATAAIPAGPAGPAREWAGYGNSAAVEGADRPAKADRQRAGVDPSRFAEFVVSVSIAGAALSAVGFLLPWASVVIGSTGSGYFDRWGLAAPGHVVVVLAILALLALSIIRNPVPSWLRTGVAGLAIGSLLLGLAWPYLLNPALEAAPGVLIEAIGSVALIGAGILALVTDRHAEARQAV
jgi:hypothetical protein